MLSIATIFIWNRWSRRSKKDWPAFRTLNSPSWFSAPTAFRLRRLRRVIRDQRQIQETVELVMQRGGWRNHHRLCYQSKVGASKWLQPSLHKTLKSLADEKIS